MVKIKKAKLFLLLTLAMILPPGLYAQKGMEFWVGVNGGYYNGLGGAAEFAMLNISRSFPLGIHVTGGYFYQADPGQAVEARRVFINDATAGNDNILENGYSIFIQVDLSYPVYRKNDFSISAYVGASHCRYLAHYDYQGGNETFDITSNPWGINAGLLAYLRITPSILLGLNAGLGYFIPTMIWGHGTFYNPNGIDDNPRAPYSYADADNSINQPLLAPKISLSFLFKL